MKTVNISITEKQQTFIDELVERLNFANRSELFRTLIRRVSVNPDLIAEPKISAKAIARYDKMIERIESGKEPVYEAENLDDFFDMLNGKKDPIPSKIYQKLRKKS